MVAQISDSKSLTGLFGGLFKIHFALSDDNALVQAGFKFTKRLKGRLPICGKGLFLFAVAISTCALSRPPSKMGASRFVASRQVTLDESVTLDNELDAPPRFDELKNLPRGKQKADHQQNEYSAVTQNQNE